MERHLHVDGSQAGAGAGKWEGGHGWMGIDVFVLVVTGGWGSDDADA